MTGSKSCISLSALLGALSFLRFGVSAFAAFGFSSKAACGFSGFFSFFTSGFFVSFGGSFASFFFSTLTSASFCPIPKKPREGSSKTVTSTSSMPSCRSSSASFTALSTSFAHFTEESMLYFPPMFYALIFSFYFLPVSLLAVLF